MALFNIEIKELHLHVDLKSVDKKADKIISELLNLKTEIMGELEDISGQLDRIDRAHDEIKKDLNFIKSTLPETGGLNAAATAAIKARVTAIADKLDALDSETDSNPTPPVE